MNELVFISMLDKPRHGPGQTVLSTVLFDEEAKVIHDWLKLDKVPLMAEQAWIKENYKKGRKK